MGRGVGSRSIFFPEALVPECPNKKDRLSMMGDTVRDAVVEKMLEFPKLLPASARDGGVWVWIWKCVN